MTTAFVTSFAKLFQTSLINRVEIPIIQRDYAQGRQDDIVPRIRGKFLEVLRSALLEGEKVSLDFVYGDVASGKMVPLDGQQRLTTLFLLHWYIAARAGVDGSKTDFLQNFTYETRYSSRDFCQRLVEQRPPFPMEGPLSAWIQDQRWFFRVWRHDPTISSMLVVLDDIHLLFREVAASGCEAAWERLLDGESPGILFHVLPIAEMGLTDDLYIRMNSRGKPLTKFEHFKANFEKTVKEVSRDHYQEFINKIDNSWSDLFWPYRGDDDIIDDEFMRYFRFITDVLIYRSGLEIPGLMGRDVDLGAEAVYGVRNPNAAANQRYLFDALDCWAGRPACAGTKQMPPWDPAVFFTANFVDKGHQPDKVAIYQTVDLFETCCRDYGDIELQGRRFSLPSILMLYAVVEHLIGQTAEFPQRFRTLRNLVFASENEIRLENLSRLLDETQQLIQSGTFKDAPTFNTKQVDEEKVKAKLRADFPALAGTIHRLEDHTLTRGCISVFDLGAAATVLADRAEVFHEVFSDSVPLIEVSGAMLACGDYSQRKGWDRFLFGSWKNKNVWRQIFTNTAKLEQLDKTRQVLMKMLDQARPSGGAPIRERLQKIVDAFLSRQEQKQQFNWCYYLVKYPEMRKGDSGLYVSASNNLGFNICMLDKSQLNSYYRDPYLYAIYTCSKIGDSGTETPWHYGYATEKRWLKMKNQLELTCGEAGFALRSTTPEAEQVLAKHGADASMVRTIPQVTVDGTLWDTEDRVQAGIALVRDLAQLS